MAEINEALLKDKLTKVCICKGINRLTIKKAIAEGADSVQKVNQIVGSGQGACKGRRCGEKIYALIQEHKQSQ